MTKPDAVTAQGCPVAMPTVRECGRPIHQAPHADSKPVCLMHSRDPGKSDAEFRAEFERILKEAGADRADFSSFVFPSANYIGRTFSAECLFFGARFTQDAYFMGATFMQHADFSRATFSQHAIFSRATFSQDTDFTGARFTQNAEFLDATFTQNVSFSRATFTQIASFFAATFTQEAKFFGATFTENANFCVATFTQKVSFREATFAKLADFRYAKFLGAVEFRETKFRRDTERLPGPVFSLAEFSRPEAVVFYKTYLGQPLLHNCDVSKFMFSSVEWRKRKGSGKRMVFEEEVELKNKSASDLKPQKDSSDERDYGLIAELYQQLKKNYDDKKDYWTAGDFHYGEMEMKRLSSRKKSPLLRWLHEHIGLVALYKYASHYGESYVRPGLLLLVLVLMVFPVLYLVAGLQYSPSRDASRATSPFPPTVMESPLAGKAVGEKDSQSGAGPSSSRVAESASRSTSSAQAQNPDGHVLRFWHPFRPGEEAHGSKWRAQLSLGWHSLWASVFVALFQKELVYEPVYLAGRVVAVVEQVFGSIFFALFVLALRRQFRR